RPDSGWRLTVRIPPPSRNHLTPTADENPTAAAASSLEAPAAIASQNFCRCSRRHPGGRPGERIRGRPVTLEPHPRARPMQHLLFEVLQRPLDFAQYLAIRYTERLAEAGAVTSVGSRGDSYDNALAETIIGLYKTELIRRRGPWRGIDDVEYATLEWVD